MDELWGKINTFSYGSISTGAVFLVLAVYFIKNPEKFQKWISMFYWLISHLWKRAKYYAIKNEIEGKINSFVSGLSNSMVVALPKVRVRWAQPDEKEELVFEEYEAIIVMRDRKFKNKNIVHATYFYTAQVMLREPKKYLSAHIKTSLDLFATKKIIEKESKAALEQFLSDYFSPEVEKNDDIKKLISQYLKIDRLNIFFPVLIQELTYLGKKVILSQNKDEIIKEVKQLVNFLETFAERRVGDTRIPDSFSGNYIHCCIKIVASLKVRLIGDINVHKKRINEGIKAGFENIYVIGSAEEDNKAYMDAVVNSCLNHNQRVSLEKKVSFPGVIYFSDRQSKVQTYLIHLHQAGVGNYLRE